MVKTKQVITLVSLMLAGSLIFAGCSSQSEAKKLESSQEQKPQAPMALENIRTDLEIIISATANKLNPTNMSSLQQSAQVEPSPDQEEGTAENQTDSNKQDTSTTWQQEETALRKIHQNWNMLEPEAIKANISEQSRTDFEMALNDLTVNIGQQMTEDSFFAAINLYRYYADLTEVFTMPIPPEFFRVKYQVMTAAAEAGRNNWETADEHIIQLQENWDNLQVQAKKADEKITNRSKLSINDLQNAIKSRQLDLVMVKSEVIMKNLQNLEDKF